jgi:hypothetical protein
MADKKRDILEFVEQSNFKQMIPTWYFPASAIIEEKWYRQLVCNEL